MRQKTIPILLAVVTLLLGLFAARYHTAAFPELSPEFSLKKSAVPGAADAYAVRLGFQPELYRRVATFSESRSAKYFLELNYGLARLKEEVGRGVAVWDWDVRYFVPGEREEFSVSLDTEGDLVGFRHVIPETESRPRLEKNDALEAGLDFIARHVSHHPLDRLKLIEASEKENPGHHVHRFTWERTDWRWGDGTYHLHLSVKGDRVGSYSEHLKIPEAWSREFAKKRSGNRIYQVIANAASVLLWLGVVVMFIHMMMHQQVRWRDFPLRWLLIASLIVFVAQVSQFPQWLAAYYTEDDFTSFIVRRVVGIGLSTFAQSFSFLLLAFMADAFWQKVFPERTSIRALLKGPGLATRESMRAVPLAFMLAVGALAYVTAYYMLGRHIGFWSPSSINYAEVLTSYFPAVEALSIGVSAALNEEFTFRVLGLVLVYRLTGSRWLAIVTTAASWGFLHSDYPQLPGYARGIELTLVGILLGWAATRFGILTTLLFHCLFNTWLGAIIVWQTGAPWNMAAALAVSVWPLGLWAKAWLDSRNRHRVPGLGEVAPSPLPPVRPVRQEAVITGISDRKFSKAGWLGASLVVLSALALWALVPARECADVGKVQLLQREAAGYADSVFTERTGMAPDGFHRTVNRVAFMTSADSGYILAHADEETISRCMEAYLYQDYWKIHYFKAEQRETYTVYLHSDGSVFRFSRSIPETAPGAQLDKEPAIRLAERYLREKLGLTPDQYRYSSLGMKQHKERRDYRVTFESTEWDIGESRLRWTVALQGDALNGLERSLKIPEDYLRQRGAQGWKEVVDDLLSSVSVIIILLGSLFVFGLLIVRQHIPWRSSLLVGLSLPAIALVEQINRIPYFFEGYRTTQSMLNYAGGKSLYLLLSLVMSYASGVAQFALLFGLVHWLTGRSGYGVMLGSNGRQTRQRMVRGLGLGLLGAALLWHLDQLFLAGVQLLGSDDLPAWHTVTVSGLSVGLDSLLKAGRNALQSGLSAGISVLLAVLLWKKRRGFLFLLLFLLLAQDINFEWESGIMAGYTILFQMLGTALQLWLYLAIFRFNPFAYLFMFYYQSLLPAAVVMTQKAWPVYGFDTAMLWAAAAAPGVIALVLLYTSRLKPGMPEGGQAAGI